MEYLPKEGYKKILVIAAYVVAGAAALFLLFRFVFPAALPLILGWLIAAALHRPMSFAAEKLKIPKKVSAVVLVLAIVGVLLFIIFAAGGVLIRGAENFASGIIKNGEAISSRALELFADMGALFEKFGIEYDGGLPDMLGGAFESILSAVAGFITSAAAGAASALPGGIVFTLVLIISSVNFCVSYGSISNFLLGLLSEKNAKIVTEVKKQLGVVAGKYAKSYFLIFLLTFGELFLGLTLIGTSFPLASAGIIAVVDILPVLGAGAVLIPWGIAQIILGNTKTGIFIFLLYAVITAVRQVVEPKIVGNGIGIHPLLSLAGMYVGLKTAGVFGMICFPLGIAIAKNTVLSLGREKI
ncbi:MAG: sporulation integral membrane protein YtvI [Clostridiales bacterium]|nr:sporulation integral membrane protein YtvI [Clostridiales bacterium]